MSTICEGSTRIRERREYRLGGSHGAQITTGDPAD
jgi:hypothetical protein